jgi:hypothetical protein
MLFLGLGGILICWRFLAWSPVVKAVANPRQQLNGA